MATAATSRTYKLGAVKPWVQSAADLLGNMFGFTNIGGYRAQGSVPNSDHPKGLALDFMTLDPKKAQALIDYLLTHVDALGIKYVIYNRRIWTPAQGWHPYSGPSPHTDHVHVSFNDKAGTGVTGGVTGVGLPNPFDPSKWPVIGQLNHLAEKLQDAKFWQRIGMYALGGGLVIGGAVLVMREEGSGVAASAVKTIAKVK